MAGTSPGGDWFNFAANYCASSYRFPLAIALAVGAGVLAALITFFPDVGKRHDPGFVLLLGFGLPMTVVAVALMVWARGWRKRRTAELAAQRRSPPRR